MSIEELGLLSREVLAEVIAARDQSGGDGGERSMLKKSL
jgi:hypothetical protein